MVPVWLIRSGLMWTGPYSNYLSFPNYPDLPVQQTTKIYYMHMHGNPWNSPCNLSKSFEQAVLIVIEILQWFQNYNSSLMLAEFFSTTNAFPFFMRFKTPCHGSSFGTNTLFSSLGCTIDNPEDRDWKRLMFCAYHLWCTCVTACAILNGLIVASKIQNE